MNTETMQDEALAYDLNGETRYYKTIWEKIEDEHYAECPTSIAAGQKRPSTLCLCDKIEAAHKSAEECLRCHQFADSCACGAKAQLV